METSFRSRPSQPFVFEPDEDELREQAATTGRGPRRLMAGVRLVAEARLTRRRGRIEDEAAQACEPPPRGTRQVPTGAVAVPTRVDPVPPIADPQPRPGGRRRTRTRSRPRAYLTTTILCDARSTAARARRFDAARSEGQLMGEEDAAWEVWARSGPEWDGHDSLATLDEAHRLTAHLRVRSDWRRRVGLALDRWAEREVAFATRLDRVLPRRRPLRS